MVLLFWKTFRNTKSSCLVPSLVVPIWSWTIHFAPKKNRWKIQRTSWKSLFKRTNLFSFFSHPYLWKFPSTLKFCNLPKLLVFYARYSLPWIMGWDFAFSSSSPKFLVRQIYVRWWEKYIVDTSGYPKMISDCNLLDPQTKTPFILQSPYNQIQSLTTHINPKKN